MSEVLAIDAAAFVTVTASHRKIVHSVAQYAFLFVERLITAMVSRSRLLALATQPKLGCKLHILLLKALLMLA